MQILFRLLEKSGLFLFFLILQGVSLYLISKQNDLRKSVVGEKILQVDGWVSTQTAYLKHYFTLEKENKKLVTANAQLERELKQLKDSKKLKSPFTVIEKGDSVTYKFDFFPVKVINNSIAKKNNFLTINRGKKDGIKKGMGVVTNTGVIGRVEYTSNNYSRVQSLLNSKSKVNAQIKGNNQFGTLIWDGISTDHMILTEIPKSTKTEKGDTIHTYGGRSIFPRYHPIGTIDSIATNEEDGQYKIRVRLFEDFSRLQYAYVVKNVDYQEIYELEELTAEEELEIRNKEEQKKKEEEEKRKQKEKEEAAAKKKKELERKRKQEESEEEKQLNTEELDTREKDNDRQQEIIQRDTILLNPTELNNSELNLNHSQNRDDSIAIDSRNTQSAINENPLENND